jgi:hypothetical protein
MGQTIVRGAQIKDGDVTEVDLGLSDVTTLDVSTAKHGFFPKLPTPTGKFLKDDLTWGTPSAGGVSITQVEIDFGSTPVSSKSFTITNGTITGSNKILVYPSPTPATGRVGNDFEADIVTMTGLAGTGSFTLTVVSPYLMVGKRNVYYQII